MSVTIDTLYNGCSTACVEWVPVSSVNIAHSPQNLTCSYQWEVWGGRLQNGGHNDRRSHREKKDLTTLT